MKVVVIGGVAAGMSTAARLRRLDEQASIVVLEKGRFVSFANCGLPYHIGGVITDRDSLLLQTPQSLKASLNLDVRTGHTALAIDRAARTVHVVESPSGRAYDESYDKLVLCPGASPLKPKLPGIDHPRLFVLRNVEDMDLIKAVVDGGARAAVVIGGGYIGVEMAENLRQRGLKVDLVEMLDQLMPPLDREMARDLESHMQSHGVRLHLGTAAAEFRDAGGRIAVELKNTESIVADFAILAVGVRPDAALAQAAGLELGPRGGIRVDDHLRTSDPDIYAAGDAIEVRDAVTGEAGVIPLAGPANRQGRLVADNLAGRDVRYSGTQGTAVVKVFEMTGGCTGATEKTLKRLGRPYRKVYLHPSGHAGYYPGSAQMHLKVLFAPDTGRLLGAQAVGYDGIDKRLDVLATALRAGLTVEELADLELAYAPPFGSAKDPVNMAGFMAGNLRKGDVDFWYAEEYPARTDTGTVVDVRSPQEYELWHIPGALNLPLPKLRASLDRIPAEKPVFLYCKVGFRSYLASRILKQRGFSSVSTLAGGSMTFSSWHGAGIGAGKPPPPLMSYAEEPAAPVSAPPPPAAAGKPLEVRCTGMQCPGPIRKLGEAVAAARIGDELHVVADDPGFAPDVTAWCRRHGHALLSVRQVGPRVEALLRKGVENPEETAAAGRHGAPDKKTMVVFSGDLDKVLAAFILATGAVAMGAEVTMFFTFWGLNALRKPGRQAPGKSLLDKMFGAMMPKGATSLVLSKMHMLGLGTAMMKHVMRQKNVDTLPALIAQARQTGVKLVACTMSMSVMGLHKEELMDGLDYGGVAAFWGESEGASSTLFI